jgi:hypothetical protein
MDKSSTPQKNVVKMERAEAVETKEVNFLSFNCKNIKTIGPFLHIVLRYILIKITPNDYFMRVLVLLYNFENLINTFRVLFITIILQDISKNNNSRRASKLKELIADCELQINFHGPTFINAKGVEVSEIDYMSNFH